MTAPACDCGGGWVNGYRDGAHVPDRTGEHSRYCEGHGDPKLVAQLKKAREPIVEQPA